ncbi:hypothetical protein HOLleu_32126 [Holothuria leucospilota]|uniref:Uncharacterized protein n=1 Tax=Holothuria leucospilota TaxID=206669 RepID=A0A9Q0YRC3_HOLLE|nr:hypothetical protein HOLleu_32126 [Holothuria leucospilota]
MEKPLYDVIIGNIEGAREPENPNLKWSPVCIQSSVQEAPEEQIADTNYAAVETRSQKRNRERPIKPLEVVIKSSDLDVTPEEMVKAQQSDDTLSKLWKLAETGVVKEYTKGSKTRFITVKGLLYREYIKSLASTSDQINQMVLPTQFREKVLEIGHEGIMAGHLGVKKTLDRIQTNFYWPGIEGDVRRFCASCDVCQRTFPKGRVTRVALGSMPLIDTPFKRVAVDLVGPLQPMTARGNRYILTLVDFATRYPEAVALPRIDTERVAEALLDIFSRIGVPEEILSDLGSQFTSSIMKEVGRLLSIKQLNTTPYHPQCNGLVERFNGTLKRMLRKMCSERPADWDRYLPALLFAYREAPQESLGFAPFELLYGRMLRGPLTILKEVWSGEKIEEEVKSTYQYVMELRDRLEATCELARNELLKSAKRYKKSFDVRSKDRKFKVGDMVLILLPTDSNKLLMQWKGPFEVIKKIGLSDYRLLVNGNEKTFHANLLKLYVPRVKPVRQNGKSPEVGGAVIKVKVINEDTSESDFANVDLVSLEQVESVDDVMMSSERNQGENLECSKVLRRYSDIFTDLPGYTTLVQHKINLTTDDPIRSRAYPIPLATQDIVKREIDAMLKLNVIEKSESPYASPIVLVEKPDGSIRFCVDFRKLNNVTVFDPEPNPNPEDLMTKLGTAKFYSRLDLTKGYWQIPVVEEDRPKTAFITSHGLFQFKVLPFGMVNAPAVFTRMMRKLLDGQENVINYIDDILIFTNTWEEHMTTLKSVLHRLRESGLTARPSKCFLGATSIDFLGHIIGDGLMKPQPDKVKKIWGVQRPRTKKEVRSFIGLANYYRKFIPNFAAIAAPLTDLTKSRGPKQVEWGEAQQNAFDTLKLRLSSSPILHLPDAQKTFIQRTDASDVGVGAVLLQSDGEHMCIP